MQRQKFPQASLAAARIAVGSNPLNSWEILWHPCCCAVKIAKLGELGTHKLEMDKASNERLLSRQPLFFTARFALREFLTFFGPYLHFTTTPVQ